MHLLLSLLVLAADPPKLAAVWTPKDKEMVVLLGSGFIEQEARDGYLETELIRLFPNKDIRVRNLGWSGDTVHCQARGYFGGAAEGFERLREHLKMIKPTTVICCYGANESWKGEAGLPDFRKGYEKLIDMIRESIGATVVLMTPPKSVTAQKEKLGFDPEERLSRYWQETEYLAKARDTLFLPFGSEATAFLQILFGSDFDAKSSEHFEAAAIAFDLTAFGRKASDEAERIVELDWKKRFCLPMNSANISSQEVGLDRAVFTASSALLHRVTAFHFAGQSGHAYRVTIDGKAAEIIEPGVMNQGSRAKLSIKGPDQKQLDQLRLAIIKKNALFFHRWRPANETYLYGFRKHEQGNNGVEPPMFDKLVEQAEAEIAVLKKPVPHKYELIRVEEKK